MFAGLKLQLQRALLWPHQLLSLSALLSGIEGEEKRVTLLIFVPLFLFFLPREKKHGKRVLTQCAVTCLENGLETSCQDHRAVPHVPKKVK